MENNIVVIDKDGWYDLLVGDIKAIITERIYRSRQEVIEGWHEVGERITNDENYQHYARGNEKANRKLAQDIGKSLTSLYYAIQFYKKFPECSNALEHFPEGKNISWHKIVNKYLAPPEEETPALPDGKFRVIYADPPWDYGMPQHGKEEQDTVLETHYDTMKLSAICKMRIPDIAQDNSVLFLWATSPLLRDALAVVDAWGFTYKGSFIWDKVKHNVGYYNSVRHEFLLICTKGSCLPDKKPEGEPTLIDSVQSIERTEHSAKPKEFYDIIENMYPTGNRVELFARSHRDGWVAWGQEA